MFILPQTPYAHDALAPLMSEETVRFHHDKHQAAYVETLNRLLEKSGIAHGDLEQVIRDSAGVDPALFNNSAQAWNHAFLWEAMTPGRQTPAGPLAEAIEASFGGVAKLREAFVAKGAGQFGSGWVWLIADAGGALQVASTPDAENPLTLEGATPLLTCDVWEHAYYLDHRNDRKAFLGAWFDVLANWRFAEAQLNAASNGGRGSWRYPKAAEAADRAA